MPGGGILFKAIRKGISEATKEGGKKGGKEGAKKFTPTSGKVTKDGSLRDKVDREKAAKRTDKVLMEHSVLDQRGGSSSDVRGDSIRQSIQKAAKKQGGELRGRTFKFAPVKKVDKEVGKNKKVKLRQLVDDANEEVAADFRRSLNANKPKEVRDRIEAQFKKKGK